MSDEPHQDDNQDMYRSLGMTLAAAAVTGTAAGGANALTQQAINAIKRPKEEPPPKKES